MLVSLGEGVLGSDEDRQSTRIWQVINQKGNLKIHDELPIVLSDNEFKDFYKSVMNPFYV